MSIHPSIISSTNISSTYPSIYLPIYPTFYLSIHHQPICLSTIYLIIYLSISIHHLSSISLSISISFSLFTYLPTYIISTYLSLIYFYLYHFYLPIFRLSSICLYLSVYNFLSAMVLIMNISLARGCTKTTVLNTDLEEKAKLLHREL